jgi:hypothetical protein
MKNVFKVTAGFLVLFSNFMAVDSLAVIQPMHRVGSVKAKEAQESGYGPTWYWLAGKMNTNEIVFYVRDNSSNNSALINIDGQDVSLKRINMQYKKPENSGLIKVAEYKSRLFRVKLKDFKDITTAKDKKGCMRRVRGFLEIISNDGWTKKIQVDSGDDICG